MALPRKLGSAVAKLTRLQMLSLKGTQVTTAGIARLKTELVHTFIMAP
jgi:hypothetical protein